MALSLHSLSSGLDIPSDVEVFLRRDEARCEGAVGFVKRFWAGRARQPAALWLIRDGMSLAGLGAYEGGQGLKLSPMSAVSARLLASEMVRAGIPIRTLLGPRSAVAAFSDEIARGGSVLRSLMLLRLFVLRKVIPPRAAPGAFRLAKTGDLAQIVNFFCAFSQEALQEPVESFSLVPTIREFIEMGNYFVWECGGRIVSIAFRSRDTYGGTGLSVVYTPPEERGRGFASSCVAAASQWLLDEGRDFCFLYTDESNPTSNSIYGKVGYEFVDEFSACEFAEPPLG